MQTVNFQCGHCGSLMAVAADFLGQQVRCPHCQQVVTAPAEAAPPAPPPAPRQAFHFSSLEERESIFTPDEHVSEDVFGAVPRPVVEMPSPPPAPEPPPAPPPAPVNLFADFSAAATPPAPSQPAAEPDAHETTPWSRAAATTDHEPRHDFHDPDPPRVATPRADTGGWLIIAVIIPLISYSILMTVLAVMFYYRMKAVPHPFEALPDTEGENKGTTKKQSMVERWVPDSPMPSNLVVALGRSITVGDLEVTPHSVELAPIRYKYPGGGFDVSRDPALVLRLRMKNVSGDVTFRPTDPFFLRAWNPNSVSGMPYTFLEMGSQRFYGGPIKWASEPRSGRHVDVYVEGQNHDKELRPGDWMNTLVCTPPSQSLANQIKSYQGRFLWRIQVRRGLVQWKDRDIPATAVIGVEFSKADVH